MDRQRHRDRARLSLRAADPGAPPAIVDGLAGALGRRDALPLGDARLAHLAGQAAHESAGFTRLVESLFYTTPWRLMAVWPRRFATAAAAAPFVRNPRALACRVYNGRLGNRPDSDDGWVYRGRGLLQLTGRSNYRTYGDLLGLPLEDHPERAEEPETAWRIAIAYLARRRRRGLTAFAWADRDNTEMVTRIVNGGLNGLADRRWRTAAALAALAGPARRPALRQGNRGFWVEALQRALLAAGFAPGAIDGAFGTRTARALRAFQRVRKLAADGVAGPITWTALDPHISSATA